MYKIQDFKIDTLYVASEDLGCMMPQYMTRLYVYNVSVQIQNISELEYVAHCC